MLNWVPQKLYGCIRETGLDINIPASGKLLIVSPKELLSLWLGFQTVK